MLMFHEALVDVLSLVFCFPHFLKIFRFEQDVREAIEIRHPLS